MRRLRLRHEMERKWLENRITALEAFKPEVAQIEPASPALVLSPRDRLLLYLAAPSTPSPQSYIKSPSSPHPRSLVRLEKTTASLRNMHSASKWRSVRLNDMNRACDPQTCFVIGRARRSFTPKGFYSKAARGRTAEKSKIDQLPDASAAKSEREAAILARKCEEQMNSSSHSAFRLSKRTSREYQSRPESRGRPIGRTFSPFL